MLACTTFHTQLLQRWGQISPVEVKIEVCVAVNYRVVLCWVRELGVCDLFLSGMNVQIYNHRICHMSRSLLRLTYLFGHTLRSVSLMDLEVQATDFQISSTCRIRMAPRPYYDALADTSLAQGSYNSSTVGIALCCMTLHCLALHCMAWHCMASSAYTWENTT